MKKYEFTDETISVLGVTLKRIRAIRDFKNVKKGDLGGFIEKEANLSHDDDAWIYDDAKVYNDAKIDGNAAVCENAQVSMNARVCGNALIYGNALITNNALVCDYVWIFNNARIVDNACIFGHAHVYEYAQVRNNAKVYGEVCIFGRARIYGDALIFNNTDYMTIGPIGSRFDITTFFKDANNKISVSCGCFLGSLEKFRKEVEKVHGVNTKYAKVYQAAADLAEIQILCKESKEAEE